ncbi:MAG: hypothetical protein ACM3ZA_08105 [Bacillota bacterium]
MVFCKIDKETGKVLARAYTFDAALKYHRQGDIKPLFMVSKDSTRAVAGFLHADGSVTVVEFSVSRDGTVSNQVLAAP